MLASGGAEKPSLFLPLTKGTHHTLLFSLLLLGLALLQAGGRERRKEHQWLGAFLPLGCTQKRSSLKGYWGSIRLKDQDAGPLHPGMEVWDADGDFPLQDPAG